jgi:hypothetical protein
MRTSVVLVVSRALVEVSIVSELLVLLSESLTAQDSVNKQAILLNAAKGLVVEPCIREFIVAP